MQSAHGQLVKEVPEWLQWLLPVSIVAGGVAWVARKILLPSIKVQLEELLEEKFAEARMEVEERHKQNREDILRVEQQMNESSEDRQKLHQDLMEVKADVAYLRGRTTGTFQRPR
jgi:septal ring factor EnvC (AmiA/AmiB activator)